MQTYQKLSSFSRVWAAQKQHQAVPLGPDLGVESSREALSPQWSDAEACRADLRTFEGPSCKRSWRSGAVCVYRIEN